MPHFPSLVAQVAGALMAMGLLPRDRPPNTYLPADFSQRRRRHLRLCGGASLTNEIVVEFESFATRPPAPRLSTAEPIDVDEVDLLLRRMCVPMLRQSTHVCTCPGRVMRACVPVLAAFPAGMLRACSSDGCG